MTTKRLNPYQYLLNEVRDLLTAIKYRKTKNMLFYAAKELNRGYDLSQIKERIAAADQLGYDVQVIIVDGGLQFFYIKKMPIIRGDWLNY